VDDVELAREEDFAKLFPGCELGAEPPFGNLYNLPVYVDISLREDAEIVFNAGTHTETIRMAYADFEAIVKPIVAPLSLAA
jgi:Ala-tRNA(Pro) deacylase